MKTAWHALSQPRALQCGWPDENPISFAELLRHHAWGRAPSGVPPPPCCLSGDSPWDRKILSFGSHNTEHRAVIECRIGLSTPGEWRQGKTGGVAGVSHRGVLSCAGKAVRAGCLISCFDKANKPGSRESVLCTHFPA